MTRASALLAAGHASAAEQMLRRLVQGQSRNAPAWNLLSIIANGSGRPDDAIEHAATALRIDGRRAEYHFSHGRALKSARRLNEAIAAYERAIALKPNFAEVHVSLGIALRLLGRLDEAAAAQREALRLKPDFPEALSNLGNVLAERIGQSVGDNLTAEDLREAEQVHRRSLVLAPDNADLLHNLAVVLKLTGRNDEAAQLFNRALAIDSGRTGTCLQFGTLLCDELRFDLARRLFTQWLGGHAPVADVMLALVACLVELGETDEALVWLDRVDALAPASAEARHQRGKIEQQTVGSDLDSGSALAAFAAAIEARPEYFEAVCSYLLTLCYSEEDPVALVDAHRARVAPVLRALPARARTPFAPRGSKRLRLGFVSSDLKRHSVAYFLEGLLEQRDRDRHEVFAYKSNAGADDVTQRLAALCEKTVECTSMSDAQLAQRCREDGIDVLIDLSGLTSGNRLGVFQRRPAPCQITWLGYPTTTGADCFDFRMTDWTIDPAGSELHSTEPLIRLPQSMFCYRPGPMPDVTVPPAAARGFITFGSFNNFSKAGVRTLELWRAVLAAVPDSRLRLKAGAFQKRSNRDAVVQYFVSRDIAAERVEFSAWQPDPQAHFAAYGEIDIALDSLPFNGATTTCEALFMGVPVITRLGATHPARMGASILGAAGLEGLVAHDDAGFVALAAALAADVGALTAARAAQRDLLAASRLMDHVAFARDFEEAVDVAFERCVQRIADAGAG